VVRKRKFTEFDVVSDIGEKTAPFVSAAVFPN
jgi:hypothetical protein